MILFVVVTGVTLGGYVGWIWKSISYNDLKLEMEKLSDRLAVTQAALETYRERDRISEFTIGLQKRLLRNAYKDIDAKKRMNLDRDRHVERIAKELQAAKKELSKRDKNSLNP